MTLSAALRNGASQLRTERSELHVRFIDSHHDWLSLSLGGPAGDAAPVSYTHLTLPTNREG